MIIKTILWYKNNVLNKWSSTNFLYLRFYILTQRYVLLQGIMTTYRPKRNTSRVKNKTYRFLNNSCHGKFIVKLELYLRKHYNKSRFGWYSGFTNLLWQPNHCYGISAFQSLAWRVTLYIYIYVHACLNSESFISRGVRSKYWTLCSHHREQAQMCFRMRPVCKTYPCA